MLYVYHVYIYIPSSHILFGFNHFLFDNSEFITNILTYCILPLFNLTHISLTFRVLQEIWTSRFIQNIIRKRIWTSGVFQHPCHHPSKGLRIPNKTSLVLMVQKSCLTCLGSLRRYGRTSWTHVVKRTFWNVRCGIILFFPVPFFLVNYRQLVCMMDDIECEPILKVPRCSQSPPFSPLGGCRWQCWMWEPLAQNGGAWGHSTFERPWPYCGSHWLVSRPMAKARSENFEGKSGTEWAFLGSDIKAGQSNSESAASRDEDNDLQYSSELEVAVPSCPLHSSWESGAPWADEDEDVPAQPSIFQDVRLAPVKDRKLPSKQCCHAAEDRYWVTNPSRYWVTNPFSQYQIKCLGVLAHDNQFIYNT